MFKTFITTVIITLAILTGIWFYKGQSAEIKPIEKQAQTPTTNSATATPTAMPKQKTLNNKYHIFQTFNNCGPASLSMALSYYGINISQKELGDALRPYQVASGDNDDKSTTLPELAEKAKEYGLVPFYRPNGNIDVIKGFISIDIPVIARTWLTDTEDISHYRVIKGYDDVTKEIIQDDSYQGKNLKFSYVKFLDLWKKNNFVYLVLVPKDKVEAATKVLGNNADETTAWRLAKQKSEADVSRNPSDVQALFNLALASYYTGDYQETIDNFEKVEDKLAPRTLWYDMEPLLAYYKTKNYDRVFALSDKILNNGNRAYSELYILRGDIYKDQGRNDLARTEYEKAILYNKNLKSARDALNSLNN